MILKILSGQDPGITGADKNCWKNPENDGLLLLFYIVLVVPPGFEPGPREPKSLVLPLHHGTG
jgi:hypothetical protein